MLRGAKVARRLLVLTTTTATAAEQTNPKDKNKFFNFINARLI